MARKPKILTAPVSPPHAGRPFAVALIALGLIAATAAVYSREAHNGFVNYDDNEYVYDNPHVRDGLTWPGLRWAFVTDTPDGGWQINSTAANWHPLTWLSHMADVSLFGWNPADQATRFGLTLPVPGWHHLAALFFHLANTVLIFLLLRRLTGRLWPPALVAALFALHPLHAESVSWISERKDLLSTLFFLLTIWAYVAWTERRRTWRYLLIVLFFALGLMAKPMLVTLPFVLLLLDFWPLGRFNPVTCATVGFARPCRTPAATRPLWRLLLEKLPLFLLVIPSCYLTWLAQSRGEALATFAATPWSFRWQNALIAPVRYLGQTFWPADLSFSYQPTALYPLDGHVPWFWTSGAAALLIIITTLVLVAALRHGRRYLAVGWFWFLGALVPVIGLVQVGSQVMADRYTYIPLIGVFIMFAWTVADLVYRPVGLVDHSAGAARLARVVVAAYLALALLVACALAAHRQVAYWKDNLTLYSHALGVNPLDDKAHLNLGSDLLTRYEAGGPRELLDQAERHYRQVLEINPDQPRALCDLGLVYTKKKRFPEAIDLYRRALRLKPDFPEGHNNLGTAYSLTGDLDDAVREFAAAVALNPDYGHAHYNLAHDLALQAAALPPQKKDEYDALMTRVIEQDRAAIRLLPTFAPARYDLGWVYVQIGQSGLALPRFIEAATLNPRYHDALFWAAFIMSAGQDDRLRDGPLALICIDQAIGVAGEPPPPADLNVRAMALAACGRFDEAVALTRRLLAQAQAAPNPDFAAILQNNLQSFEAHKPLRLPTLATQATK